MTGRPPKVLTKEQIGQVEKLSAVLSQDQMAEFFGISRPTFAAMLERDEELCLRYKKGRAKAIASIAGGLIKEARAGNIAAICFYLKTQGGWRETAVVEHGGKLTVNIAGDDAAL